jgi:BASS family bile acid:Na+ symporter
LRRHLKKPAAVLLATGWTMIAIPALAGIAGQALDLPTRSPDLFLGLMLQAVASPMMAAPALAAVMGLDVTLVLLTLVVSTAVVPLTAPLFARLFLGDAALRLSPLALGRQLFVILAGSALLAAVLRRVIGPATIARNRERLAGLNVLVLFVFVGAPAATFTLLGLVVVVFVALLGVTTILFSPAGGAPALALGLLVAQRNLGLMLAATGGAVPDLTWVYIALSQFPIYLSPYLLTSMVRRALDHERVNIRGSDCRSLRPPAR